MAADIQTFKIIKETIQKHVNNIRISIYGLVTSVSKNGRIFLTTFSKEEIRDVNIVTPYGLNSLPTGGEAAAVIMNSNSTNAMMVGISFTDKQVKLEIGETLLYNAKAKTYIHLKNDGTIRYKGELIKEE